MKILMNNNTVVGDTALALATILKLPAIVPAVQIRNLRMLNVAGFKPGAFHPQPSISTTTPPGQSM